MSLKIHQPNIIKIIKKNYEKARERYQSLSKEEKEKKGDNMVVSDSKISQKMKKSLLSIGKNIVK